MALNAIKAPLVAYEGGTTITVNGAEVSIGSGDAYYITSTLAREQRISEEQLTNSNLYTVEFGERYFPNLRLNQETDEFERPSYTWVYENTELGTYVNYDMLTETYTAGVDGRDLYELLGRSTIEKYDLTYYVDGAVDTTITSESMYRGNTTDYGTTGNGVLTQVFIDHDTEEIIITSINTYLAQANANYNANSETLSLNVFESDSEGTTKTVDSADVPNAVDVVEDQFVLVNMSKKDRTRLEVVKISDVEILTDTTVTKFSTKNSTDPDKTPTIFSKLTADGEEYNASKKALYDKDFLNLYDASLLTDMSYNVYLDQYGYAIGVDLFEGELNYVFITGYDRGQSYISIKTAEAGAIFLDGSMEQITVNVTNTNKNIDKLDTNNDGIITDNAPYYDEWDNAGDIALNTWYTYTVDGNDVYTLKPVEGRMFASNVPTTSPGNVINSSNVRLEDEVHSTGARGFGNDDSVYIAVETGEVDMSKKSDDAIVDVNGLYTGVQDVDIEFTRLSKGNVAHNAYTLVDSDQYIIASIVLGDAQGSTANYAYILSSAKSEGVEDGVYQWEFEAVMNGEKVTLTARSQYPTTINDLKKDTVQELRFNGDYVVAVKGIDGGKFINDYDEAWDDHEVFFVEYTGETLELQGRTLQSSGSGDRGWTITSTSMPTVLRQTVNGSSTTTNYGSMNEALSAVGDANTNASGLQFRGTIVMVLNGQGVAQWAFIDSDVPVTTGGKPVSGGDGEYLTYSAKTYESGYMTMSYNVEWPEWLAADANALGYAFDIIVDGDLYYTETGTFTANSTADHADSWNNGFGAVPLYFISPVSANSQVSVDNFRFTNLNKQTYNVRYVDQSGNEFDIATDFNYPYSSHTNGGILADAPMVMSHNLKNTLFGGGTYSWSITGVEDDPTDTTTTVLSRTGVTAGADSTTGGRVKVIADWMDYVTVTINTGNMVQNYTVTGDGTHKTLAQFVPSYNGYYANQPIDIEILPDGSVAASASYAQTVADNGSVEICLDFGSTHAIPSNAGWGLKITLNTGDEVLFTNSGSDWFKIVALDHIRENMEIEIVAVEAIETPTVTWAWNDLDRSGTFSTNDTVTLTFSDPVNVTRVPVVATGTATNSLGGVATNNVSEIVYTFTTAADGSIITLSAGDAVDADGLQVVPVTLTIAADGTITRS